MKNRLRLPLPLLTAVFLAFAAPAGANVLVNGNLDGTLDPWTPGSPYITYDADHTATPDGSGSGLVELPNTAGTGAFVMIQQCVGVTEGTSYIFGSTMRISSASPAGGSAYLELEWHAASDCSDGGIGSFVQTPSANLPPGPTDVWETVQRVAVAPAGATHALVIALVQNSGALPTAASGIRPEATALNFIVSIDDLFLDPIASSVPTLGGAGLAVLLASLAGAAVFLLRR